MTHAARSFAARLARCLLVLVALSALSPVRAGTTSTVTNSPMLATPQPGGWTLSPGPAVSPTSPDFQRLITQTPDRTFERLLGGKVPVFDPFELPGKAGKLPVRVARGVAVLDAAAAVARCLSRSVVCAAAIAAGYVLYQKYRVKPDGEGGLLHDEGQPETVVEAFCWKNGGQQGCYSTSLLAFRKLFPGSNVSWGPVQVRNDGWLECYQVYNNGVPDGEACFDKIRESQLQCPAVFNFPDPAYSVPGGAPGADGKCPTGTYYGISPAQAASKVVQFPPQDGDQQLPEALRDAVHQGESVPSTITTSGPESQAGTPSKLTTTTADGTTTTTETPTYKYKYEGDSISYTTEIKTETCAGANSCSTTTTTTEGPKPSEDEKDPCTNNPNRVGCMELGSPPTDSVPKSSRDVSFTADDLGLPAACPAPVPLPHGQQISYQTVCDGLTQARPLIIAIGFLMAGAIVVAALRG